MNVYIAGKRVQVSAKQAIGKGGEADIYRLGADRVLKLFKPPEHPDFAPFPEQRREAARRIATHQQKLPAFPAGLPKRVIAPIDLAMDRQGSQILGYTMRLVHDAEVLLRYGDKAFRQQGISGATVTTIFRDLHNTVAQLHALGLVIGDFNDLNVLVRDAQASMIDADSFQFGPFLCAVYTERFVDPLLCDKRATRPVLTQPYSENSDWYAFAVMLFRSLLLVDPYGGVYKPKQPSQHIPHSARPLHRLTVFDPAVVYPRPAYRYDILPDELLQYFHQVFVADERGMFPRPLFDMVIWHTCPQCHLEYARTACPACSGGLVPTLRAVVRVLGSITVKHIVTTAGSIVTATTGDGTLCYLVHTDGAFVREDNRQVIAGDLRPGMSFRLLPDQTLIGQGNQLVLLSAGTRPERLQVDTCDGVPSFAANGSTYIWVQDGQLMRPGSIAPEAIGQVLAGQTHVWVGTRLGFGFYRAGELHVAFVFDPQRRGLNDNVRLPAMHGQLVDVTCQIASDRCWLVWTSKEGGRLLQHVAVILAHGQVVASLSVDVGTTPWIESVRGALAVGSFLLVPTDEGIVRVEVEQGRLVQTKTFLATQPYVDAASRLLPGPNGLYVVREHTIDLLLLHEN